MFAAHKIELRPTQAQSDYIDQACGSRRHCYNQLLAHFKEDGVKWSKKAAYAYYIESIRTQFDWYAEISSRVTRNAIDDLDNAFKHFFRRVKLGQKPGFPTFKKKDQNDSFAMREVNKFDVVGRSLRVEKLKTRIKMRQRIRFSGEVKQVTISKRAGKYFASFMVDTEDVVAPLEQSGSVGVDLGIKELAVLSDGKVIPSSQPLKRSLKKLKSKQKKLSRKQSGSNRRAKAKYSITLLHYRVANQRAVVLHELSNYLTKTYKRIVLEDLNVKGMVKNHCLARAISDAGFGMFRQMVEYKAKWRGVEVVIADRFFPSSKTCSECGSIKSMHLNQRTYECSCGMVRDRDLNAAINLNNYGRDTLKRDPKRTQEKRQTYSNVSHFVDGVNLPSARLA